MAKTRTAKTLLVAGREIAATHPDKVLFPQGEHNKLDLVCYYLAVADGALRGAGGRPNMLVRYPNGIEGEHFYQKRVRPKRSGGGSPGCGSARVACEPCIALAREVENRAPTLATSKWWKEEREGSTCSMFLRNCARLRSPWIRMKRWTRAHKAWSPRADHNGNPAGVCPAASEGKSLHAENGRLACGHT
jgi:DNA primase